MPSFPQLWGMNYAKHTFPFVTLGRTSTWEPGLIKQDCDQTLTAYRHKNLGGRRESEVR
jgi:hypothetical protein